MAASLNLNAGEYLTFPAFTPTDATSWSFSIDFETPTDIVTDQAIVGYAEVPARRKTKLYIRDSYMGLLHISEWSTSGLVQFEVKPNTRYQIRAVYEGSEIRLYAFGQLVAKDSGRDLSNSQGEEFLSTIMASTPQGEKAISGETKIYAFDIFDDAESTILARSYNPAASIEHSEFVDTVSGLNATPANFTLTESSYTEFYDWSDLQVENYGLALPKNHYAEFEKPTIGAWAFRFKVYVSELSGQMYLLANKGELGSTRFYARVDATGEINAYVNSPTGSKIVTTSLAAVVGYNEITFFVDFRSGGYMRIGVNGEFENAVSTFADFEGIYNDLGDNFAINAAMFEDGFVGGGEKSVKFIELAIFRWDGGSTSLGACWDVFDFNQPNHFENTLYSTIGNRLLKSSWDLSGYRLGGLMEEDGKIVGYQMSRDHYADTEITDSMTDYEIEWVGYPDYFDSGTAYDETSHQALWHKQDDGQIYMSRENQLRFYIKSQGSWKRISLDLPPVGVRVKITAVVTPTRTEIYINDELTGAVGYPERTAVRSDRLRINRRSADDREDQGGIWAGERLKITCHNNPSLNRDYDFTKVANDILPDVLNQQHATFYKDSHYGFVKVAERDVFTDEDYPTLSDFVRAEIENPNPITYKNGKGGEGIKDFKAFIDWVNLPDEFHTTVTTGEEFIIATDPLGVNRLPVDLRHYDPAQSLFKAWTRMYEYGSGEIWILYGKSGFTQPTFEEPYGELAVWDDEESVFHLSDAPSNDANHYHNSAGKAKGTGYNFTADDENVLSPVGYGTKFEGARYHISALTPFVDSFMFSAWVNTHDISTDGRIMSVAEWEERHGQGEDIALWVDKDDGGVGYAATVRFTGSASNDVRGGEIDNNASLNQWQYVAVHVFAGGVALWVDGVEQFRKLTNMEFDFATWDTLYLAKLWENTSNAYYPGSIASARVTKFSRQNTLAFECVNQGNPATFWTAGEPEEAVGTEFARRVRLTGKSLTTDLADVGAESETLIIDGLEAKQDTLNLSGTQSKIFTNCKLGNVDATSAEGEILIDQSEVGDVKG